MMVSMIMVSHNRPTFVKQAIESIIKQTYPHWELIVIDSGVLYDQGYFSWVTDPRIKIIKSGETEEMRGTKNMASWCTNEYIRNNELKGELILYCGDDDIYYSCAFETFVNGFKDKPEAMAMYASQDYGWVDSAGNEGLFGERLAIHPAGRFCGGVPICCRIDMLQFCHRKEVFAMLNWNLFYEGLERRGDADGEYMSRVGDITTVYPINIKVSLNRRTPTSYISPTN